ncbi:response regulator [Flavobacterium microcysteis]
MKEHANMNIVLVDEDVEECRSFRKAIEEIDRNLNLLCFNSCEDVMEYLNDMDIQLPNIIFLEIHFPTMSGIDCLKEIRSHDNLKDLTIAIYSNSTTEINQDLAFHNRANIFVKKQKDFEGLKKTIKSVVQLSFQFDGSEFNKDTFLFSI